MNSAKVSVYPHLQALVQYIGECASSWQVYWSFIQAELSRAPAPPVFMNSEDTPASRKNGLAWPKSSPASSTVFTLLRCALKSTKRGGCQENCHIISGWGQGIQESCDIMSGVWGLYGPEKHE